MENMERVLGVGGVFFKAKDPAALIAWYRTHLGIETAWEGGTAFESKGAGEMTVWSIMGANAIHFDPSRAPFMINYRVANLDRMLAQLRALGDQVEGPTEQPEFGKFGWVMDPEGHRIELWEPPA